MVEKSHTAGWWPNLYEPLRGISDRIADWFAPRADAAATQEFYEISMELPGVVSNEIDVSVSNGTLTIKGQKQSQRQESGRTYFFTEREYGAFQRSFRLPPDVEPDKIGADFRDGVLTVKVPKAGAHKEKAKKIEIRSD